MHDPEAASDPTTTTPLGRLEATLATLDEVEAPEEGPAMSVDHRLRVTPHGLDAAKACPRRHFERVRGWRPEAFGQRTTTDEDGLELAAQQRRARGRCDWPAPTVFGTMMHRVLELGLQNPAEDAAQPPLPASGQEGNRTGCWTTACCGGCSKSTAS